MKEEVSKLKTPTDAFRVAMLDRAKQFGGAKKYALQQAYIELLEDDLLNDTFKDISLLQMNDVYSTLLHQTKETMVFPDLELVTKYGIDNEKIHLYKSQTGSHYFVCNIGVLIFRKGVAFLKSLFNRFRNDRQVGDLFEEVVGKRISNYGTKHSIMNLVVM